MKFDEFTNNAKIFDFGNDKQDNVFLGIIGKGDPAISQMIDAEIVQESTIPQKPSGAQAVMEMSPRRLMETTSANGCQKQKNSNAYCCQKCCTYGFSCSTLNRSFN